MNRLANSCSAQAEQKQLLHPATQLMLWLALAVLVQALHGQALFLLAAMVAVMALWRDAARLQALLRRTRWILLSLVLLYAYVTPGEALVPAWGSLSPVREGLYDGSLQLARLLSVLAGLAVLLHQLTREQLIAGMHALLYPVRWLGVDRGRIAVRLALTLHYADQQLQHPRLDAQHIHQVLTRSDAAGDVVELPALQWCWRDGMVLVVATGLAALGVR